MAIDLSRFYQTFFDEAKEHLQEIERLLVGINVKKPDFNQLNAVFRAAHSIKGGSATFDFNDITTVTHLFESLLDKLRKKELNLKKEMVDAFLLTTDVLNIQLSGHIKGVIADASLTAEITRKLLVFSDDVSESITKTKSDDDFGFFDAPNEGSEKTDGFGFFEPTTLPTSEPITPTSQQRIENNTAESTENRRLNRRAGDRRASDVGTETSSIRVDIAKVDQLINLVGELVITQAMLTQKLSHAPADMMEALSANMDQLQRNTRDLQEVIMSVRMMPISNLFSRFPRLVRDLAGKLNKEVELITIGEETELDKSLIEKIADPLTHLIRNSLDHGIELPQVRIAAGKPADGKVILSAMHLGGNIIIEVTDDGAGLNSELIIKKAKQRGIAIPNTINDDNLWEIISQPGFSTSENISDISGRGVGMDVVNRNIQGLGGQIQVTSYPGKGCTFSIQLPLTLAIVDGMIVSLGENLYVVPLNAIIETIQPQPENLKSMTGGGNMVLTRDEYIPIIAMHLAFNTPTEITDLCNGMLVIVESHGKKAALFLDNLVGQQQVVIKNLETNFHKVNGISAATILGDGKVALIIDVPAMIKIGQNIVNN